MDATTPAAAVKAKRIGGSYMEAGRVADLIDMSVRYVKERIKDGSLKGYRMGNRIVVSTDSLQAFIANREIRPINAKE